MVRIKYTQRISLAHRGRAEKITIFNTERLKDEVTRKVFKGRLEGRIQEEINDEEDVLNRWQGLKRVLKTTAEEILGVREGRERKEWFYEECERVVRERNEARLRMLQRKTHATTEEFNPKRRTVKTVCRQK
jgi:hypothetical protein